MNLTISRSITCLLGMAVTLFCFQNCNKPVTNYEHISVYEDSLTLASRTANILRDTPIELAEGLTLTLWASDSLAPDPVAMSIDDFGSVYLTRTNRQKNSEFDIRGYSEWITSSIALQSVEDRRAFLKKTFAPENSDKNSWLKNLNKDSLHDWRDLAVEKDEIWRLDDQNNDGVADVSTRILDDFNSEISDVAGALLVRRNDIFAGVGPDMWRITDSNGDGKLDTKVSIAHGFAVHIGFSGHGMSGAVEGPDGKIYWGIGDIGANITTLDGRNLKYPNQGVLVRSNPDGSDFEVFAAGLRNTHEFVFDEYGNIIGADNDGDHPDEMERLVHIVEGSDAGWRTSWQFGKYTDSKNNKYKVWMDEKLHLPRWEGQAAYIIPPIKSYHNGPTGMVYNPGTALGSRWQRNFFLVEFAGTPTRSPIWAFSLKPKGASFELDQEERVIKGILPTGIRFGPDGALYAADWINGWGTKNYGRVWKLDVEESENDLAELRAQTQKLMQLNYEQQDDDDLYDLLFYEDMRIRQKAQLELANRGKSSKKIFEKAIAQTTNQLARIHGIWGIGQLIRINNSSTGALLNLLNDSDPEIVAQAVKVLGEAKVKDAGKALIPLLQSDNLRVKFFAAQSLGRIKEASAIQPLLNVLEENADQDVYIRHAAVLALSRIGDVAAISKLKDHPNRSIRLAAVLILRRMKHPGISGFLQDDDVYIVTEAARAINDDWSIKESLPDLAALLVKEKLASEPLIRRAINAAARVGGTKEIDLLIEFSKRDDIDPVLRADAIDVLGTWQNLSPLDRVDGRYRGDITRDPAYVISQFSSSIEDNLKSDMSEVVVATSKALANLNIQDFSDLQADISGKHNDPQVRASMISSLFKLKYPDMENVIERGLNDSDETVRTTALGLVNELDLNEENLSKFVEPIFDNATIKEQQQMLEVLGQMSIDNTEKVFDGLISKWIDGKLDQTLELDLIEAIDATNSNQLIQKIEPHRPKGNTLADFTDVLYGGDSRAGSNIFWENSTAQCVRCHSVGDEPGVAGPSLKGIANKLSREQLLQALIEPSARLAPGYGTVILTLTDNTTVSGILMEEDESELHLKTSNAEPLEISIQRILKRQNIPSSMPAMGSILSRREIRDIVGYLSGQKD